MSDVNERNEFGRTKLWYAAFEGEQENVEELVRGGADVNSGDDYGITPLMMAARRGYLSIVRFLCDAGADVHRQQDDNGETALKKATESGQSEVREFLLSRGARE